MNNNILSKLDDNPTNVNWPLSTTNIYPPSPESVLASKLGREDAVLMLSKMIDAKVSIDREHEITQRHYHSSLVDIESIKANKETTLARIEKHHQYKMAKLQVQRDTEIARRNMVGSIVNTALQTSVCIPPVNKITVAESRGGWFRPFDYKFTLEIE